MYVIFTVVGIFGIMASSFIPESYKEDFPECVEDIERRKKHPYFSWRVWIKQEEKDGEKETK